MTRWSCRRCSAGPPRSWRPRSAPDTNERSCTGTTSYCSDSVDSVIREIAMTVLQQAIEARSASIDLATATRAEKDAALLLMADRLVERAEDVVAANAVDVENARTAGMSDSMIDRLTLTTDRV